MNRQAIAYFVDGRIEDITPRGGPRARIHHSKIEEIVGGTVQHVPLPDGRYLLCNDNGVFEGLPPNVNATAEWRKAYPRDKYPVNNPDAILGNVIFGTAGCF